MGKRSDFDRIPRDKYMTPKKAIDPLLFWIEEGWSFAEPCAGDGGLARHLEENGHVCLHMSDIEPEHPKVKELDVFDFEADLSTTDCVITNPPWDRKILHPLIEHLSDQVPTWLLFDTDWMHTKQAIPFLPRLRRIISVGRVKWIPGSTMTGKDNCAWYHFTKPGPKNTVFIGRSEIWG
ncbi:class I SAM-dependent methyltransferase [Ruegeria arenilitoris]|uniref:class I SAM-dependent methyltransferase n=1 Tax=Ruegeria arenilitoris TaxID=1173585 RepID=UPI001480BC87|nr:class I SAM-dependent methyltransferase [Ruegeria arenilitoris]